MEIAALLPLFILIWPLLKLVRKGWRLLSLLLFTALITGCAGTSSQLERSPCACDFEILDIASHTGQSNA